MDSNELWVELTQEDYKDLLEITRHMDEKPDEYKRYHTFREALHDILNCPE